MIEMVAVIYQHASKYILCFSPLNEQTITLILLGHVHALLTRANIQVKAYFNLKILFKSLSQYQESIVGRKEIQHCSSNKRYTVFKELGIKS